jgi:hypothetical protein
MPFTGHPVAEARADDEGHCSITSFPQIRLPLMPADGLLDVSIEEHPFRPQGL